jgi:uncharacterized membrane protein YqaE (UPF0057 family)
MKKLLFLGISISLLISSCSIQKRVHNSGFHVTWKNREHSADKNEFLSQTTNGVENLAKISNDDNLDLAISADIENEPFVIINSPNSNESFSFTSSKKDKNETTVFSNQNSKSFIAKNDIKSFPKVSAIKKAVKKVNGKGSSGIDTNLLFILCFIFPVIAVGLATDWDLNKLLLCFLLSLLCWVPGIIYALITVKES